MKKIVAMILCLSLSLSMLAACGNETSDKKGTSTAASETPESGAAGKEADASEAQTPAETEKYTIGIAYAGYEEYHVEWEKYAKQWLEDHYGDSVEIITTVANNNAATQQSDIESLIVQRPDAILVWAVDSEGSISAVESIYDAGIKTILISYGVNTEKYDLYLYADQIHTGKMQADYCLDWIENHPGETLNCGYIWGVSGISGCIERFEGWRDNCVDGEKIVLLDEQIGNWNSAEAMAIAEDWLQAYPEMNCIVCMSDEMALGVIQALQGANVNMDDFVVLGIDGSASAQLELDKGTLDGTVFENRRLAAEIQMEYTMKLLTGETIAEKNNLIECKQMMTPENKQEILDSLN